jgi:hypothetical protein
MVPCLILGDSLAVGVGQARPECSTIAEVGMSSGRFLQSLHGARHARTVVISLGVNDSVDMETLENLRKLRRGVSADAVYWLMPGIHPPAREAVRSVAREFRDRIIEVAPLAGADRIHPDRAGYAQLASLTRRSGGTVYADLPAPGSAYGAFPERKMAYRDFPVPPPVPVVKVSGVKVWAGPYSLNGLPVPPTPPKKPPPR